MPFTEEPSSTTDSDASGSGSPTVVMPMASGSGSGDMLDPDIITCSNAVSEISASEFDQIGDSLEVFECILDSNSNSTGLLFTIVINNEEIVITQEIANMLLTDFFDPGSYMLNMTVCTYSSPMESECDGQYMIDLGNVVLMVTPHQGGVFPFGENTGDSSFRGVLDGAISIPIPQTIPFYSGYYHSLYVSRLLKL